MNTEFEKILKLIKKVEKQVNFKFRILDIQNELSDWSSWISNPAGEYIDFSFGPFPYREIIEVQINPIENKHIGKLVPNQLIDRTDKIQNLLNILKIDYSINNTIFIIQ